MRIPAFCRALGVYLEPAPLRMFFLGFSSGLPLLLVLGTLGFWLREASVDLKTIGFLSWVGLVYGFKWVWAPALDTVRLPLLTRLFGRRRSWILFAQAGVAASLASMAFSDPASGLGVTAAAALSAAFFSATQDIAIDAYRIESARAEEQAALAATYQTGYRLAMIWAGAGALAVAAWAAADESLYEQAAWRTSYLVMAASMAVGVVTVLLSAEPGAPAGSAQKPERERLTLAAVAEPFRDFFVRYGRAGLLVLCLIATYRISDVVMGIMANPFYSDTGFTKEEVAAVSKVFGVVMTLLGAFAGGIVTLRIGVLRTLMLGALLSAVTNVLFAVLAQIGHSLSFLVFTVSADNLAAGLAGSAFVAYLSGLTSRGHSATQYAVFSSLMLLLPKFAAGFSGVVVEAAGYSAFFLLTAALGLPVLLLIWLVGRFAKEKRPEDPAVRGCQ